MNEKIKSIIDTDVETAITKIIVDLNKISVNEHVSVQNKTIVLSAINTLKSFTVNAEHDIKVLDEMYENIIALFKRYCNEEIINDGFGKIKYSVYFKHYSEDAFIAPFTNLHKWPIGIYTNLLNKDNQILINLSDYSIVVCNNEIKIASSTVIVSLKPNMTDQTNYEFLIGIYDKLYSDLNNKLQIISDNY